MDATLLLKYRQIAKLAREGSTPGEKAAAEAALKNMETKHPGIGAEVKKEEASATRAAQMDALRKAGFPIPDLDLLMPEKGWVQNLIQNVLKNAAEWAIQKLAEDLPPLSSLDLEEIMARARKSSHPSLEEQLLEWKNGNLGLEADDEFDDDDAGFDIDASFSYGLWKQIQADPKVFVEFIDSILRGKLEDEGVDTDDDEDEEDEDEE